MDILWEILGEIFAAIVDSLLPSGMYDNSANTAGIGCCMVFLYIVMMVTAIGMGIWVLSVNVPAGIALIVVGALLFIGSLIGFFKIHSRMKK